MEKHYKENILERRARLGTDEKIAAFRQKQSLPYAQKVILARKRAEEFEAECMERGLNTHVSVGGLDSITLADEANGVNGCAVKSVIEAWNRRANDEH